MIYLIFCVGKWRLRAQQRQHSRCCGRNREYCTRPAQRAAVQPLVCVLGACRIAPRSAAAEMLVEVDDLGALLKSDEDVEIGPFSALERDRLLDVVADAGAFLGALESDADRKLLLAEDCLTWSG